jgi:hypothetical protein
VFGVEKPRLASRTWGTQMGSISPLLCKDGVPRLVNPGSVFSDTRIREKHEEI